MWYFKSTIWVLEKKAASYKALTSAHCSSPCALILGYYGTVAWYFATYQHVIRREMKIVQRIVRGQERTFICSSMNQVIYGYPKSGKLRMESRVCNIVHWPTILNANQIGIGVQIRVVFASPI